MFFKYQAGKNPQLTILHALSNFGLILWGNTFRASPSSSKRLLTAPGGSCGSGGSWQLLAAPGSGSLSFLAAPDAPGGSGGLEAQNFGKLQSEKTLGPQLTILHDLSSFGPIVWGGTFRDPPSSSDRLLTAPGVSNSSGGSGASGGTSFYSS